MNPRRSSYCHVNGDCVEVTEDAGVGVGVRDTKQENQAGRTELVFTPRAWRTFVEKTKAG